VGALPGLHRVAGPMPVTVVSVAPLAVVLPAGTLQQTEAPEAPASWRPLALLVVVVVLPEHLALLVLPLLLADCSVKAAGVVVAVLRVLVVQVVRAVAAQVAVVARVAAAHTQQVLAGLVVLVGLWYWSFDHAAICRG